MLADFTHIRACKPFCEKYLTLPTFYNAYYIFYMDSLLHIYSNIGIICKDTLNHCRKTETDLVIRSRFYII